MKKKIRTVSYLPRRLFNVLADIMPFFMDENDNDPRRGALTKALEHVIQQYMESEDYLKKVDFVKNRRWERFVHASELERKLRLREEEATKT